MTVSFMPEPPSGRRAAVRVRTTDAMLPRRRTCHRSAPSTCDASATVRVCLLWTVAFAHGHFGYAGIEGVRECVSNNTARAVAPLRFERSLKNDARLAT